MRQPPLFIKKLIWVNAEEQLSSGLVVITWVLVFSTVLVPPFAWVTGGIFYELLGHPGGALQPLHRLLILAGALVVAWALVEMKARIQILYGVIECLFAVVLGWRLLDDFVESRLANAIAIGGVVFILNRGITNYREGKQKQREKKAADTPLLVP
jgi:hypothetical protein